MMPRLALATILNGKPEKFFTMCATVCSSFVPVNSGTHMRSFATPMGNTEAPSVQQGNLLASRSLARHDANIGMCV